MDSTGIVVSKGYDIKFLEDVRWINKICPKCSKGFLISFKYYNSEEVAKNLFIDYEVRRCCEKPDCDYNEHSFYNYSC